MIRGRSALYREEVNIQEVNVVKNDLIKSYWSNEVAKLLDISTSALRKWSLALEAAGYSFIRDENAKRAYLEKDLMPLHKMRELLADGMGMDNAANAVVLRFSEQIKDSGTMVVLEKNEDLAERYVELVTQNQELRMILERIEKGMQKQQVDMEQKLTDQQNYIEESLNRRDELLMLTLHEITEARKQAASTKKWRFWK